MLTRGAAAGAGFALLAVPFVAPFLLKLTGAGVNWNTGPSEEFYLPHAMGSLMEPVTFFVRNVPIVATAMLAPVSETSFMVPVVATTILVFMALGFLALARAEDRAQGGLAVFTSVLAVVWIALLAGGKITLSPTRHSLVLVPVFTLLIVTGAGWLLERAAVRGGKAGDMIVVAFSFFWLGLFLVSAPGEIHQRTDRLSEQALLDRLRSDGAEALAHYQWSHGPTLMPGLRSQYPILDGSRKTPPRVVPIPSVDNGGAADHHLVGRGRAVVAFYSAHKPFAMDTHGALIEAIGRRYGIQGPVHSRVIREERIDSRVEIEWSSRTHNGTNGFYYTVVEVSETR